MNIERKVGTLTLALLVMTITTGCGGERGVAKGKIVQKGQPVTVSDKGLIIMNLVGEGDLGIHGAEVAPDGTFVVKGPQGEGIPTGKYTATIQWFDPYSGGESDKDKLGNKFTGEKGIPVTVEKEKELVIDVANPQGS